MAENDRPHFQIPSEEVTRDTVHRTGRSATFVREDYGEHGAGLVRQAQDFRTASASTVDSTSTEQLFLQVRTPEELPIRNEKQRFKNVGLEIVEYSRTDPNAGTARIAKGDFDELEQRLLRYATQDQHPGRSYLSAIEQLGPVPVEEKLSSELEEVAEPPTDQAIVFLYPGLREGEAERVRARMEEFVGARRGEVISHHHFSSGLTTLLIRLNPAALRELGEAFATLKEIRPNRLFFVEDATPVAPLPNPMPVNSPQVDTAVAVVDSGIRGPLFSTCLSAVVPALPTGATQPLYDHGTFVGSRVAFGDDLEADLTNPPLQPRCNLVDVPIFGRNNSGSVSVDEHHLATALDTAIPALPDGARVVNLSLGTNQPIQDDSYSLTAMTVDHLARTHDILFVTTSGNVRDPRLVKAYPSTLSAPQYRIDPPGEALLALTVGSYARFGDSTTLAEAGQLSPFSRIGPGADSGLKPEVVAHGGNYLKNATGVSRYSPHGVHGNGTALAFDNGTSFAAPIVSGIAARLFSSYPGASANLIKALLCHFTRPVGTPNGADPLRCAGLGTPEEAPAIAAREHSAAYLYSGEVGLSEYLHIPFYVPFALEGANRDTKLRIRATLVYDPPVDQANHTEYSCARIAWKLRKPVQLGFRDVSISSNHLSYVQWNPVLQFDKTFSHSYDAGTWELRLRLYSRNVDDDYTQRFSVVVEIFDVKGGTDVWQEITDEAGSVFRPAAVHAAA